MAMSGGLVSDSTLLDQAVANLRGLSEEIRAAGEAAGLLAARGVQCWADRLDTAVADLLEVQRRARYAEVFAAAAALVDVTVEGPPACDEVPGGSLLIAVHGVR